MKLKGLLVAGNWRVGVQAVCSGIQVVVDDGTDAVQDQLEELEQKLKALKAEKNAAESAGTSTAAEGA